MQDANAICKLLTELDAKQTGLIGLDVFIKLVEQLGATRDDVLLLVLSSCTCDLRYKDFLSWLQVRDVPQPGDDLPLTSPKSAPNLLKSCRAITTEFLHRCISLPDNWRIGRMNTQAFQPEARETAHKSWRVVTWNVGGEVSQFEFLPMPEQLTERVETLAGAAVLRLAGVSDRELTDGERVRWKRYAPDASPQAPRQQDVNSMGSLTIAGLLSGFNTAQLFEHWERWSADNKGGKEDLDKHLSNWCSRVELSDFFRIALQRQPDTEDLGVGEPIPGIRNHDVAIISNADSWFSGRTYHIRGADNMAYFRDAADVNFKDADFWGKWIKGLSDTYSWQVTKPIEFLPSKADLDYISIAIWDRFLFLTVRQILWGSAEFKKGINWEAFQHFVEITKDDCIRGVQSVLNWVVCNLDVDLLCLQEAKHISIPGGWQAFPEGESTLILLRDECVNVKLTDTARELMEHLKESFRTTSREWARIEETVIHEANKKLRETMEDQLEHLDLDEEAEQSIKTLAELETNKMVQMLEETKVAASSAELRKIEKWFDDNKIALVVGRVNGQDTLIISAHGESLGTTCLIVLALAHSLHLELQKINIPLPVLVGMDSNVKVTNKGAAASPERLAAAAVALGFCWTKREQLLYAGSPTQATHSVCKTRTFLQTQLANKAGIPDENLKDWVFYLPWPPSERPMMHGRVINKITPGSDEGKYVPGGMPRGVDFPSDHALVMVTASSAS